MAQSGFTPVQLYRSTTASAVPLAADLAAGELAINIADMKLYAENSAGAVTLLASASGASGDVVGPASATGNNLAAFNGTTGKLIKEALTVTVAQGGTGVTTSTGTTNVVLSNSPTLVTPALGTPASGVVTNLTGTASININGTVGTTTPSTGAFTTLTTSGAVTHNAGTANGVAFLDASKVLTTGSALTFDGTNLGIGATPTVANACTNIEFPFGATLSARSNTAAPQFAMMSNAVGNWYAPTYKINGFATRYEQQGFNGEHAWSTAVSGTAGNAITFNEQMRLTSTGLGIGTSSPSYKLDVSTALTGTAAGDNTAISLNSQASGRDANIRFGDSVNATARIGYLSGALYVYTNGAERARIDSSGNLLVGTTSVPGAGTNGISVQTAGQPIIRIARAATTSQDHAQFMNGNGIVGSISTNASATVYAVSSDYRLKTVIGPVANAGQRIDALQPVEYTWNASGERTRGFLAHQFAEVYAGSVSGTKDAVDAEGKPVYQAMQASTSEVIADLVAELQALRARVASLESN